LDLAVLDLPEAATACTATVFAAVFLAAVLLAAVFWAAVFWAAVPSVGAASVTVAFLVDLLVDFLAGLDVACLAAAVLFTSAVFLVAARPGGVLDTFAVVAFFAVGAFFAAELRAVVVFAVVLAAGTGLAVAFFGAPPCVLAGDLRVTVAVTFFAAAAVLPASFFAVTRAMTRGPF